MAKKTAIGTKTPRALTDEEVKDLGDRLKGTGRNIYTVARNVFGNAIVEDATFDRVEKLCRIFKCEQCGRWLDVSNKDRTLGDFCDDCADKLDD